MSIVFKLILIFSIFFSTITLQGAQNIFINADTNLSDIIAANPSWPLNTIPDSVVINIANGGTLNITGFITMNASINLTNGAKINIDNAPSGITFNGNITFNTNSSFTVEKGSKAVIGNSSTWDVTNSNIVNLGQIDINGIVNTNENVTVINTGDISAQSPNPPSGGIVNVNSAGTINSGGQITNNDAQMTIDGILLLNSGASLSTSSKGRISQNTGFLYAFGATTITFTDNSTYENFLGETGTCGVLSFENDASLYSQGKIQVLNTFTLTGQLEIDQGGNIDQFSVETCPTDLSGWKDRFK